MPNMQDDLPQTDQSVYSDFAMRDYSKGVRWPDTEEIHIHSQQKFPQQFDSLMRRSSELAVMSSLVVYSAGADCHPSITEIELGFPPITTSASPPPPPPPQKKPNDIARPCNITSLTRVKHHESYKSALKAT